VRQHLVEPAAAVGAQLVRRGRPRRGDRREDAAAGGEDLQVGRAALAELQLALPAAREEQVGVRVDEARRDRAARGVDDGKPVEVTAGRGEIRPQRRLGRDPEDPAIRGGQRDAGLRAPSDLALLVRSSRAGRRPSRPPTRRR
jgi:hypothetical protein